MIGSGIPKLNKPGPGGLLACLLSSYFRLAVSSVCSPGGEL